MRISHLLFAAILITSCSEPPPDEQQIRHHIEQMAKAVGEKDLSGVMGPVHEDFLGNERIRKANLRGLVLINQRRHKHIHVLVHSVDIQLHQEGGAIVNCHLILAGRNDLIPERGRVLEVTSHWKKIDGDWYVISASWHDPLMPG